MDEPVRLWNRDGVVDCGAQHDGDGDARQGHVGGARDLLGQRETAVTHEVGEAEARERGQHRVCVAIAVRR